MLRIFDQPAKRRGVNMLRIFTRPARKLREGVSMLRNFIPYLSILGGQYLPDRHEKHACKTTEKSNYKPSGWGSA
jgi:hypothetical protein